MAKPFNEIFDSFTSVMELLRNPQFQDLLVNYERTKKIFLVGYEVNDNVSSETLFEANGRYGLKPEDYLIAFSEFIKHKEKEIEAITILLNRPNDWSTKALTELREKLRENDYEEDNLRKAHKIVYHKDAVDIISMVKHAAKESEPLLNREERVERAIQKITANKQLNEEQQKWMGYIREHLKQNMTIDENDFGIVPALADRGGFRRFKRAFPNDYDKIIRELNYAIAA
jgi:type I restriction enzyme, R subunit